MPDPTAAFDPKLDPFLRAVTLLRERVADFKQYPFSIPAVRHLETLELHPRVTFLVGENGTGKSTLLEAIAVASGFNPEGGTTNFRFSTRASESDLCRCIRLIRGVRRPKTGYFLRAESFFNVATYIETLDNPDGEARPDREPGEREGVARERVGRRPVDSPRIINSYGGKSLHEQSHGESFLSLVKNRFGKNGLYLLDEPEAALSPQRQLAFLTALNRLVAHEGSQFIIATHSPLILAFPDARILHLSADGMEEVRYEQTEHYALTRDFLNNKTRYLDRLLAATD